MFDFVLHYESQAKNDVGPTESQLFASYILEINR